MASFFTWFRPRPDPTTAAIAALSDQLTNLGARLMTALDNLNAAVTRLSTALSKQNDAMDHLSQENADLKQRNADLNTQLQTALASGDPAAIQSATDAINNLASAAEARAPAAPASAAPPATPAPGI
jgi:cell division protein FtsB